MAYARMDRGGGQMPLECDAEHIVDCFTGKSSNPWPHVGQRHVKERIVRCRDCKHMHVVRQWTGIDMPECWLHASRENALGRELTEPDGFCSWGCRKQ